VADEWASPSASEVVGAAPAQLESSNELIHFDHEYYRMAPPVGDDVALTSEEDVVCEVEVSSEEMQTADIIPQPNTECAILPSVCDLDLSVLADPELWDNLEQIIAADQLLDVPPLATPETPSPQEEEPPKQTDDAKILPVSSTEGCSINSLLHFSMDTVSVEPWSSSQLSGSDLEASSSGIGSPFSDDLVDHDDYGFHWEESFMELFLALA